MNKRPKKAKKKKINPKTRVVWIAAAILIVAFLGWLLFVELDVTSAFTQGKVWDLDNPLKGKTVVVDAGHGGTDGGVLSPNLQVKESDLNWAVASELKALLEKSGVTVIMTRNEKEGIVVDGVNYSEQGKKQEMAMRKKIIKDSNADLFVSVHMNRFEKAEYKGAQTFYYPGSTEGEKLAAIIQNELINGLDKSNTRKPRAEDFYVLYAGNMPSTLVECGFVSNPEEEKLLADPDYQKKVAWCIYSGLMNYGAQSYP